MYKPMRDDKGVLCFEFQEASGENHQASLERMGFVAGGKGAALKHMEAMEFEIAQAAAQRAHQERTMSDNARAEAAAVDDSTDKHVPEIPAKKNRQDIR